MFLLGCYAEASLFLVVGNLLCAVGNALWVHLGEIHFLRFPTLEVVGLRRRQILQSGCDSTILSVILI